MRKDLLNMEVIRIFQSGWDASAIAINKDHISRDKACKKFLNDEKRKSEIVKLLNELEPDLLKDVMDYAEFKKKKM